MASVCELEQQRFELITLGTLHCLHFQNSCLTLTSNTEYITFCKTMKHNIFFTETCNFDVKYTLRKKIPPQSMTQHSHLSCIHYTTPRMALSFRNQQMDYSFLSYNIRHCHVDVRDMRTSGVHSVPSSGITMLCQFMHPVIKKSRFLHKQAQ